MSLSITVAVANLMLNAGIGDLADGGKLRVYDGSRPASCATAVSTQVKLLEFELGADAFPAASSGAITAAAIATAAGLAVGTATWFRMLKADGTTVLCDGTVTEGGGGGDCIIDDDAIVISAVSAIQSLVISQPLA